MSMKSLSLAAFAAAATLVAAPAHAQGLADLGRIFLGLPSEEKADNQIDYRERAPLVVPPGATLRPPVARGEVDQRRTNWPRDPDVAARRQAAEDARKPIFVPTDREAGRVRTPAEMAAVRRTRGSNVDPNDTVHRPDIEFGSPIAGAAGLRAIAGRQAAEAKQNEFYSEPRREFLTDPPSGLRAAAGSAPVRATRDAPTGVGQERVDMFAVHRGSPNTR